MNPIVKRLTLASCFACLSALTALDAAAERRDQTYVKSNYRTAAKSTIPIAEPPNHEVANELGISAMKYSSPDFKVTEEWNFNLSRGVDGTGQHQGQWVDFHSGGEQTYGSFEGTYKTTANADGSWETTWQGTYKYLGGTGKYKNIKGGGNYKGRISSSAPFHEEGREVIEY
jgi:hypothetical protein